MSVSAANAAQPLPLPLQRCLAQWRLIADGQPVRTHSSDLLPVRTAEGIAAIVKVPRNADEQRGSQLMQWWAGDAAPVLAVDTEGALLMIRATGPRSLAEWSRSGRDSEATHVLCAMAARLHAPREYKLPMELPSLRHWFRALEPAAAAHGGLLARAHAVALTLLDEPRDEVPLHGDLHHDNVLDFGPAFGWLAIDPHAVFGERGFDYANLFCNPQLPGTARSDVALQPGIFERRVEDVVAASGLERRRLLQWIVAYCGLSAAWFIEDGDDAALDLSVAAKTAAMLDA